MPTSLSSSPAWLDFVQAVHGAQRDGRQLRILPAGGLQVDLTAQAQSPELDRAGAALLAQQGFDAARQGLFAGAHVNWTEDRPAWHTALRAAQPPASVTQTVPGRTQAPA